MHEQALIQRAVDGDREAFEAIIERYQGVVYGYLRARLLQATDAEDLTQEVFLRFYMARARFDTASLVRPWLLGIARNLLREHVRTVRRRREVGWTELCLAMEETVRFDGHDEEDVLAHLPGCLDSLGPSARAAIDMRYRSNLRLASIGEKLKRSEGAVKLLMHRARQALKHCLDTKLRNES
jgi:RNA polymerase sigma-70 factor, ECF subfamily